MIIVLGHQKQVGKDTAARAMAADGNVLVKSLADPLYRACRELHRDFKSKDYYDSYPKQKHAKMSNGITPREMLLGIGQKVKEVLGKRCWVDSLLAEAERSVKDHLVIPDVRFKEEVEALKEVDAIFIKVIRPGIDQPSDVADDDLVGWNGWDREILNSGNQLELEAKAIRLYLDIIGAKNV